MAPKPEATSEPAPAPPPAAAPEPTSPPPAAPPPEDWATRFRYLYSDFENYRRRSEREREQARQAGRAEVLKEILPMLETFDKARDAAHRLPRPDPLRLGLELLAKEWELFLRTEGVEPVARIGELFRAEEQEAVAEVPAAKPQLDGTIAEIVQQGYRAPVGLLRPAKVVVARQPSEPPAEAPATPPPATSSQD